MCNFSNFRSECVTKESEQEQEQEQESEHYSSLIKDSRPKDSTSKRLAMTLSVIDRKFNLLLCKTSLAGLS